MRKIVILLLSSVLLIPSLSAVEYIPVEESQRIRIEGYDVNNGDDYLTAYDVNNIRIDYVSAYSDIDYIIRQEPKSEKGWFNYFGSFWVSYDEKVPFRVEFKRESNPDIIYYQDIEIPCQEQDLETVDIPISIYTGNTTEFGAVSGNEVFAKVELADGMAYDDNTRWFVTDEEDNLIKVGYSRDWYWDDGSILEEEESIAGKYKLRIEVSENGERKVAIKEFEIVD